MLKKNKCNAVDIMSLKNYESPYVFSTKILAMPLHSLVRAKPYDRPGHAALSYELG